MFAVRHFTSACCRVYLMCALAKTHTHTHTHTYIHTDTSTATPTKASVCCATPQPEHLHLTMSSCVACHKAVGAGAAAGGESSKILKCGRCLLAVYCSQQCQRRHWKAGHKEQCFTKEVSTHFLFDTHGSAPNSEYAKLPLEHSNANFTYCARNHGIAGAKAAEEDRPPDDCEGLLRLMKLVEASIKTQSSKQPKATSN